MKFKSKTTIFALSLAVVAGSVALTFALSAGVASVSASSERIRDLHLTKECSEYTRKAGSFCTITSSSLARIKVGSKVFYDQDAGIPEGLLDSNTVLALDGDYKNRAVGRCTLDLTTFLGLCTYSDGTGKFAGFNARLNVDCSSRVECRLDGTYSFDPRD